MSNQKYKAIVFDWDGTLVDTCGLILDAHNHVRKHYDLSLWTMNDFLGKASQSAREYYPKVYGNKALEAEKILYDFVLSHHLQYIQPMQFSDVMLQQLTQNRTDIAVVSNKRHDTLHIEISHMNWAEYFGVAIGAGFASKDKPAADPLLTALTMLNPSLSLADVLYVGDTETDLLCAQNAGCDAALVQSDKPRPDLIERYKPVFSCNNLSELQGFLDNTTVKLNKSC